MRSPPPCLWERPQVGVWKPLFCTTLRFLSCHPLTLAALLPCFLPYALHCIRRASRAYWGATTCLLTLSFLFFALLLKGGTAFVAPARFLAQDQQQGHTWRSFCFFGEFRPGFGLVWSGLVWSGPNLAFIGALEYG